jgi:hypothetical protein
MLNVDGETATKYPVLTGCHSERADWQPIECGPKFRENSKVSILVRLIF